MKINISLRGLIDFKRSKNQTNAKFDGGADLTLDVPPSDLQRIIAPEAGESDSSKDA